MQLTINKLILQYKFNRNILYCKFVKFIDKNDKNKNLIETFCIVNVGNLQFKRGYENI